MMTPQLLLLGLLAFEAAAAGSGWQDYAAGEWPVYGGALPTTTSVGQVQSWYDRTTLLWLAWFRSDQDVYAYANQDLWTCTSATQPYCSATEAFPGLSVSSSSSTHLFAVGYNSWLAIHDHATTLDSCPLGEATTWASTTGSCDGTTTSRDVRLEEFLWWSSTTTPTISAAIQQDVAFARNFVASDMTASTYHLMQLPRIAIADMLCMSHWDSATHKFVACINDPRLYTLGQTAIEITCGGKADASRYSVECLFMNYVDPSVVTTPANSWGLSTSPPLLLGTHHALADGHLMWSTVWRTQTNPVTVQVQFSNGTFLALKRAPDNVDDNTPGFPPYYIESAYWSGLPLVSAVLANAPCQAYRFRYKTYSSSAWAYYPVSGWLKTYGIGSCTQDYCVCLDDEWSDTTSSMIHHDCCKDNCFYQDSGALCRSGSVPEGCVNNAYCTGLTAVCPANENTAADTACNRAGFTPGTCNYGDICDGAGACVNNFTADESPCDWSLLPAENDYLLCNVMECHTGECIPVNFTEGTPCDDYNDDPAHPFAQDPVELDCWDQFTCDGYGTCLHNWRSDTHVCNADGTAGACDTDDTCTGHDETCPDKYLSGNVCHPSRDACDPAEVCNGTGSDCPDDVPCEICGFYTNSVDCLSDWAYHPDDFYGCKWCGHAWGCFNKSSDTDFSCLIEADTCEDHHPELLTVWGAEESTSLLCDATATGAGSIEFVTIVTPPYSEVIMSLCFVLDLEDDNMTSLDMGVDTISMYAVLYNVSAGQPDQLLDQTPAQEFAIYDRGLIQIDFEVWGHTTFPWGIAQDDSVYVGIVIEDLCPLVSLVSSSLGGTKRQAEQEEMVWSDDTTIWNPTTASWTTSATSAIGVVLGFGFCGDKFVSQNETCDTGIADEDIAAHQPYWCHDCQCWNDTIYNPATGGCMCNATLPITDGHYFIAPPTLNVLFNEDAMEVGIQITLPQAIHKPTGTLRWEATADLVNSRTGEPINETTHMNEGNSSIWMEPYPCYFWGVKTWDVAYLMENGEPRAIPRDTYYAIQFAVNVCWNETVTMYKRQASDLDVQRLQCARLTFELHVQRTVNATSDLLEIIDSTVLWAYVKRGFLVIPDVAGEDPYFDVEVETLPKYQPTLPEDPTLIIEEYSWVVIEINGHISRITEWELVAEEDPSFQTWAFHVEFDSGDLCGLSSYDNFTMQFTMISDPEGEISPSNQTLTFALTTTENWCSADANVTVPVHADLITCPERECTHRAKKFLRGSTVYCWVNVTEQYGMLPSDVNLTYVEVWGGAIINPAWTGAESLLPATAGVTDAWDFEWYECEGEPSYAICFSFFLPPDELQEQAVFNILATVEVAYDVMKRAVELAPLRESQATTRLYLQSGKPAVPAADKEKTVVVVYRVTPAMLAAIGTLAFISVLSIVATVWFIRRRESHL